MLHEMPDTLVPQNYQVIASLLAPALLMAATGSLLVSANARLARVVDRLRSIIAALKAGDHSERAAVEQQVARHRRRAHLHQHVVVDAAFPRTVHLHHRPGHQLAGRCAPRHPRPATEKKRS